MASLASLLCHFFNTILHENIMSEVLYLIGFGFSIKERVASVGPPILLCLADLGHHINVTHTMHCQKRVWALINFANADVSELLITQIQIFVSIQSLLKSIGNISIYIEKEGMWGTVSGTNCCSVTSINLENPHINQNLFWSGGASKGKLFTIF